MNRRTCLTLIFLWLLTGHAFAIQEKTLTNLGFAKNVHAQLIIPDGQGPFPGLLVLHTGHGFKKDDLAFAKRMAQQGYACLVPHYFETHSISYDTRNWATTVYAQDILDDFKSEIEYLKRQRFIANGKIAALGFGMGGYWALILAAKKNVQAGISYYGDITGGGLSQTEFRFRFINTFSKDSSPILVLQGDEDLSVNHTAVRQFTDLLKAKSCAYEFHHYPGVGQGFDRGISFNESASKDSWQRTLTFLKKNFTP